MKTIAIAIAAVVLSSVARAAVTPVQPTVLAGVQDLDFDRPESWAMKYFTSITLPTGVGPPRRLRRWQLRVQLEPSWIPFVSDEQRTVGFDGTKQDDLNKLPAIGFLRFTLGLPWRLQFTFSYLPPIEINGVQANLLTLGLGRPFSVTRDFTIGVTAYGQYGTIHGDFTCSKSEVQAGDDPVKNPFGCTAQSHDDLDANYFGMQASASYRIRPAHGLEPYVTAGFNYMNLAFTVDATYGHGSTIDHTKLETRGTTFSTTTGLAFPITRRVDLGAEVFYSPLTIQRPMQPPSHEGLINVRGVLAVTLF
jgi:opacity protein-like surface antigen